MQTETRDSGYATADHPHFSTTVAGWLTSRVPGKIAAQVSAWNAADWEAARWAIQVHGIAPLLHHASADQPDFAALHPDLRTYLADQHSLSNARISLLLNELGELLTACHAAEITVIPLKGSLLATHYYPEPGLRPMNDLDLLIRPDNEARILDVLASLRYRPVVRSWKHVMLARPDGEAPITSWAGEHPANPRNLDLHIRVAEQFWGMQYDLTTEAWTDSEPGMVGTAPARLLQPTILLHHLCIHTSSNLIWRRMRMLNLHDIALVARQVDSVGWQRIVDYAQARREARMIYPALALTRRYYPIVPESVLATLRAGVPARLLAHLDQCDLGHVSFCNRQPRTFGESMRWFRPGWEQANAVRHALLPNPGEITSWYPDLAGSHRLPLVYARYGADMLRWGVRRLFGRSRLSLARYGAPPRQARSNKVSVTKKT